MTSSGLCPFRPLRPGQHAQLSEINDEEGLVVYIGGGAIVLILIILLVIWLFRR